MDDFRKHLEYGKQAKGQGIRFERVDTPNYSKPLNQSNRLEEVLRKANPEQDRAPMSTIPVLSKPARSDPPQPTVVKVEKKKRNFKFFRIILIIIIIACLGGTGFYAYKQFLGNPTDEKNVLKEVGKQVGLPKGEEPTIATVTNLDPLKGQEFFKDAQIGDKVLIFSKSKKAILYRPTTKKIIAIAPING